jgi:hypothetical protein
MDGTPASIDGFTIKQAEPPQTEAQDLAKKPQADLGLGCFFLGVLSAEPFHPTCGIHELLLASKKRMAIRTDFYVDVSLVSRAGGKAVAARALHADFIVSGMNGCLHGLLTPVPKPFDSKGRPQDSANGVASS